MTNNACRLSVACAVGAFVGQALSALSEAPPPTRAQIESDWLRQDAKRLAPPSAGTPSTVTREDDAGGAVDGLKDGKWGFHTEHEKGPWWQVDLGAATSLDRVVVWNRCDSGMAERNSRILLLTSEDGKQFQEAYQHDGTAFYGFTDKKPLIVRVKGLIARYVRLSLEGTSYFHLDEVEVFAAGSGQNIALGKPATQSSVSQWSSVHPGSATPESRTYPMAVVQERGLKLAESQKRLGIDVETQLAELLRARKAWSELPADVPDKTRRQLYFQAHWAVRAMALANPLLDFDSILFVKRAPGMFPHMSDQYYGWWSRPGGGVFLLEGFKSGQPRVRCLTQHMPEGSFLGPDLSYDGRKILFACCTFHPALHKEQDKANKANVPEDAFYHIYEMNIDGSGQRQLTHGKYDDFDPRWLPSGDILFVSTRKGLALQCSQAFSDSTRTADLPDSYVRCGGDNYRPVPVFTLHGMDADGRNIRPLSAFENFEWTPSVANDGRILYTRWDYIDRFNGHFFSLWSANQDGGNPQLVYGNYTVKPQVAFEARSVPGSSKLVITAGAHHSITGGTLCLLDRTKGTESDAPIIRLTPEVPFPETGGWAGHYYANPWPLSEEYFLVGWADAKLPPHCFVTNEENPANAMGIYLYDAFGNLELLYRDPDLTSMYPIPARPRPKPPVQPVVADWNGVQEGRFLIQDVYQGLSGVPHGSIKQVRIVGVPPKNQPQMNSPMLGVSAEDPGKFVLGTVPVEADGSAYFRVPSGVPVFVQALDEHGLAVQTMRSLTYTMPGQTLSCVGCHEHRDAAPSAGRSAMAVSREPSRITPGPEGSWSLRFDRLIQPVLNAQCVSCHSPGSKDVKAAKLDLTVGNAWKSLVSFGGEDLRKQAFERDRSIVGEGTAANSKLWNLLTEAAGHEGVHLADDARNRFATWMDTYAQRQGYYSDAQEKQLVEFRSSLQTMLLKPAEKADE